MTQLQLPPSIGQNIARAKSLVRRDDPVRALDALIRALDLFEPESIIGKARFEIEVTIQECLADLNRHPKVRALLDQVTRSHNAMINYKPGEENTLKSVLHVLRKGLFEVEQEKVRHDQEKQDHRKSLLLQKASEHLDAGEKPRGKAMLRLLADEFGSEPGVLLQVGTMLIGAKLHYDAAEFLEAAIEAFPKEGRAYQELVTCYLELREWEKAESVYRRAIRQFGAHPKTMLNLAKLYMNWNKKEKAFEAAQHVLRHEPDNAEAKAIIDKVG